MTNFSREPVGHPTSDLKPLKVLYISHYGVFGGAQRSILELVTAFTPGSVAPHFISPAGPGERFFRQLNIPYTPVPGGMSKFDHTRMGRYHGARWLIVLREIWYLIPTAFVLWRFRKPAKAFDLIHINELTCLPALVLSKKWYRKPVVLHARAVFYNRETSWLTRYIKRLFERYADRVVAIDETVARSLEGCTKIEVIHNSFSTDSPVATSSDTFPVSLTGLHRRRLTLGFIGAIHRNKGIMELLHAVRHCRDAGLDVCLVIAGNGNSQRPSLSNRALEVVGLNQDKNFLLNSFIAKYALQDYIHPIGFSARTNEFFEYIDVLCFPSYYNALGRPVFEAAFFKKPSIVALRDPLSDTFVNGKTGIMVEEKNSEALFGAIARFYENPDLIHTMGANAHELANRNFNIDSNASKMLKLYQTLARS